MRKIVCDKCRRSDLAPLRPERFSVEILCEKCAARLKAWCVQADDQEAAA